LENGAILTHHNSTANYDPNGVRQQESDADLTGGADIGPGRADGVRLDERWKDRDAVKQQSVCQAIIDRRSKTCRAHHFDENPPQLWRPVTSHAQEIRSDSEGEAASGG